MSVDAEKEKRIKRMMDEIGLGGREEAVGKAIAKLTDEDKVKFLSFLAPGEDDSLAIMYSIANRYRYTWLQEYVQNKLELRNSVAGLRAEQLARIAAEKHRVEQGFSLLRMFKGKDREKHRLGEIDEFE